jgi:hypothetical protein
MPLVESSRNSCISRSSSARAVGCHCERSEAISMGRHPAE